MKEAFIDSESKSLEACQMANRNDEPVEWADRKNETPLTNEARKALYHALYDFLRRIPRPNHYPHEDWYAECLHEGWCAAESATHTYDSEKGSLYNYIRQAVHNHLISYFDRERRWEERYFRLDALKEKTADAKTEQAEWTDYQSLFTIDEIVDRLDIEEALSHLTESECRLIRQVWIDRRPQIEVARELGISQPAVSKRLKCIAKKYNAF
ncbi:MAG: sigma-70 family RNA polymerase sigma factor [Candidatus Caldarchaeum sp.]